MRLSVADGSGSNQTREKVRSNPVAGRMRPPEPGWVEIEDEGVVARCGWRSRKTTMKVKLEALRKLVFQMLCAKLVKS